MDTHCLKQSTIQIVKSKVLHIYSRHKVGLRKKAPILHDKTLRSFIIAIRTFLQELSLPLIRVLVPYKTLLTRALNIEIACSIVVRCQ